MASGWGELTWGLNNWGDQGSVTTEITGIALSIVTGNEDTQANANVNVTGSQLNLSINSVAIRFDVDVSVTGIQNNLSVGQTIASIPGSTTTTGSQINLEEGLVTIDAQVREGWGVYQWGAVPWGGEQDPEVNVVGSALEIVTHPVDIQIDGNISVSVDEDDDVTIAVGSPSIRTDVAFNVTGSRLNISEGLNTVLIIINVNVPVTGSRVDLNVGQVEAFQETPVPVTTAGRLNVLVGNESTTADANVTVTGSQLNGSLGQIKYIATYSVTGSQANLSVGTVTFVITGSTTVTGSRLNVRQGSVNIQGWSEVQTGANNTWTPVDIAA